MTNERKLAEAIKNEISFLKEAIKESNSGGWSTHLNKAMQERINELREVLADTGYGV